MHLNDLINYRLTEGNFSAGTRISHSTFCGLPETSSRTFLELALGDSFLGFLMFSISEANTIILKLNFCFDVDPVQFEDIAVVLKSAAHYRASFVSP